MRNQQINDLKFINFDPEIQKTTILTNENYVLNFEPYWECVGRYTLYRLDQE